MSAASPLPPAPRSPTHLPRSRIPIILLKTASTPSDPYETHFRANPPYDPIFVPVLSHQYVNLDVLQTKITNGLDDYSDLIVTSQRAVEAFGSAIENLKAQNQDLTSLFSRNVYVVGPATASAITALGFSSDRVLGSDCGNGAALALYITSRHPASSKPLLFLVGEIRRDIIPRALAEANIEMEELIVYETSVMESFRSDFERVVREARDAQGRWVVVFSPQGAEVALEVLQEGAGKEEWKLAAIGPTTEAFLKDKAGRAPDVVAPRPSPVGLWQAVTGYRGEQDGGSRQDVGERVKELISDGVS